MSRLVVLLTLVVATSCSVVTQSADERLARERFRDELDVPALIAFSDEAKDCAADALLENVEDWESLAEAVRTDSDVAPYMNLSPSQRPADYMLRCLSVEEATEHLGRLGSSVTEERLRCLVDLFDGDMADTMNSLMDPALKEWAVMECPK